MKEKENIELVELMRNAALEFLGKVTDLNDYIKESKDDTVTMEIIQESGAVEGGIILVALINMFFDEILKEGEAEKAIKQVRANLDSALIKK